MIDYVFENYGCLQFDIDKTKIYFYGKDYKTNTEKMMIQWWQNPLGNKLLEQEKAAIQSLSSYFHGSYQLQIGLKQALLPTLSRPAVQKIMADSADLSGDSKSLPFKCHSIDTLLLVHVLEFSSDPHQVLREADRVLVADGTIILCSFNPWSLWGLRRLFSWQDIPPWQGTFFSQTRIKDWLALLNFEVINTERLFFRPPMASDRWLQRFEFTERWGKRLWPLLSGTTIIIATKRTIPLTPIKMTWRAKQLFPRPLAPSHFGRSNIKNCMINRRHQPMNVN